MAVDSGIINADLSSEEGYAEHVESIGRGAVAGGFIDVDHAFVYMPAWFTSLGEGVLSSAAFSEAELLVSGFWPDWEDGGAGSPLYFTNPVAIATRL